MCDRCGFQYKLHELQSEVVDLNVTGTLVCPECWDPDQPQLQLGRWPINDPQAIRNPRPPQSLNASRYGDALRYDFDSSDEVGLPADPGAGFSLTLRNLILALPRGTVSWNSSSNTLISRPYSLSSPDGFSTNGIVSPWDIGLDTSLYDQVEIRVKVNDSPVPNQNASYYGAMYWRNEVAGYPYAYSAFSKSSPDWFAMGDPYHVLNWDLRGNSDWSGTIESMYWVFFGVGTQLTTSGVYEIDYVSFERVLRANPQEG